MSVNSEMTALADAIREKSGRTEKMGIAAMKEAVKGISAGIDTSDATATATDIASGKTAYVDGQKITGNVVTLESGQTGYLDEGATGFGFSATNNQFFAMIPMGDNVLFRNGSYINARVSTVLFGDATAADVVKGKTFTSANGLKLTGTFEGGGGLPAGISAVATGTFKLSNTTSTPYTIAHDLGVVPDFVVVFNNEDIDLSRFNDEQFFNVIVRKVITNHNTVPECDGYQVLVSGYSKNTYPLVQALNPAQVASQLTASSFTIHAESYYKLTYRCTYRWIAGVFG